MCQIICKLLLRLGTFRLAWHTIQSLQKRHPRAKDFHASSKSSSEHQEDRGSCVIEENDESEEVECIHQDNSLNHGEADVMMDGESKKCTEDEANHNNEMRAEQRPPVPDCAVIETTPTSRSVVQSLTASEMELLHLWCILALHTAYQCFPIERVLSVVLPLYYYFKMILLFILFLPKSRVPNLLFGTVVVPTIDCIHSIIDRTQNIDYKALGNDIIAYLQLFPLVCLDTLFLPGLFAVDINGVAKEGERNIILVSNNEGEYQEGPLATDAGDQRIPLHEQGVELGDPYHTPETTNVKSILEKGPPGAPNAKQRPCDICDSTTADKEGRQLDGTMKYPTSPRRYQLNDTTLSNPVSELDSPRAQSRVSASSMRLRQFSHDHDEARSNVHVTTRNGAASKRKDLTLNRRIRYGDSPTMSLSPFSCINAMHQHQDECSPLAPLQLMWGESNSNDDSSSKSKSKGKARNLFQSYTDEGASQEEEDDDEDSKSDRSDSDDSSISENSGSIYIDSDDFDDNGGRGDDSPRRYRLRSSTNNAPSESSSVSSVQSTGSMEEDATSSIAPSIAASVASSRASDMMRTLLTGNSHIRVRDYLFDLDLPVPSCSSTLSSPVATANRTQVHSATRTSRGTPSETVSYVNPYRPSTTNSEDDDSVPS